MSEPTELEPIAPVPDPQPRRMRPVAWAIIGVGGLVAVLLLGFFGLRLASLLKPAPTPACVESSLTLGTASYRIQPIKPIQDKIAAVPKDAADIAYWVQGTNVNYVFALSDAPLNLALKQSLKPGDPVTIEWANCNSSSYTLQNVVPYAGQDAELLDQSTSQVTVLLRPGSAADSFVLRGELIGESLTNFEPPASGSGGIQAEISLGDTVVAPDGQTITVGASVHNIGPAAFSIKKKNVSLTSGDGLAAAFVGADPALPRKIGPDETVTFGFNFARPAGSQAAFKLFDAELDVEFR
jgi:hypothetical protein